MVHLETELLTLYQLRDRVAGTSHDADTLRAHKVIARRIKDVQARLVAAVEKDAEVEGPGELTWILFDSNGATRFDSAAELIDRIPPIPGVGPEYASFLAFAASVKERRPGRTVSCRIRGSEYHVFIARSSWL